MATSWSSGAFWIVGRNLNIRDKLYRDRRDMRASDLNKYFSWFFSAAFGIYAVSRWVVAVRDRPHIAKSEIIYQEWFASGASRKNFITSIGGARNCLRLVVTRDTLWITSWFPFILFSPLFDLEHVINRTNIKSVERTSFLGQRCLVLAFSDRLEADRSLRLVPKNVEQFIAALGIKS